MRRAGKVSVHGSGCWRRHRLAPPLPPPCRRALLLVCRRWHDAFWSEPALWQQLTVRAPGLPGYPRDLEREARWLADRRRLLERAAPLLRTLVLHDGGPTTPFGPVQLASLLPCLAAAPALERLERRTHRLTEEDVAALEGLTQLTTLVIESASLPLPPRREPTATRIALLPAKLPALRSLVRAGGRQGGRAPGLLLLQVAACSPALPLAAGAPCCQAACRCDRQRAAAGAYPDRPSKQALACHNLPACVCWLAAGAGCFHACTAHQQRCAMRRRSCIAWWSRCRPWNG